MKPNKKKHPEYTLDEKLTVVQLYNEGYGGTTIGWKLKISSTLVKRWLNLYDRYGLSGLERRSPVFLSGELKAEIIRDLFENSFSCETAGFKYDVNESAVRTWKAKVMEGGYEALTSDTNLSNHSKEMGRPKKKVPETELEKLQEENLYLRAENAF